MQRIVGVVTAGRANGDQWVETYKVMVSTDGMRYSDVQCGSVFVGNNNQQATPQP